MRLINPLVVNNAIDANILDDVADGEDEAVRRIVELYRNNEIIVFIPYSVKDELARPSTPKHVKSAAKIFLFSSKVKLTAPEIENYKKLVALAKGDADAKNIAADLFHVAEAAKYGGYFISRDKRLLKRAAKIAELLQVDVVTPSEFVARVDGHKRRAQKRPRDVAT